MWGPKFSNMTETTLPTHVEKAIEEVEIGRKSEILNRENTIRSGQEMTIRYRTYTGLSPRIDVYDDDNALRINKGAMTEVGTTGIYEYTLKFLRSWGRGDFTIICSESTKGTLDALIVTVIRADLEQVYNQVSAVLGSTSRIGDLQSTAETLNSQFAVIETALSKINRGLVGQVEETVAAASDLQAVYSQLANISKEIKELSGDQGVNLGSLYEVSEDKKEDIQYLKNKTQELKATTELNLKLMENVANKPVTQTWFEFRSIVLKIVGVNPSQTEKQKVILKAYLPKEAKPEDILEKNDLQVIYDTQQGSYYVYGEYDVAAGEFVEREIEMSDIWVISETEIETLRLEAEKTVKLLQNTEFEERANFLKQSIETKLEQIANSQKYSVANPERHISDYRDNKKLLETVKKDLLAARSLLAQAKPVSLTATWKLFLAIVIFLGILGLSFYH